MIPFQEDPANALFLLIFKSKINSERKLTGNSRKIQEIVRL